MLTVNPLIPASSLHPVPGGMTLISILSCWYCNPPSKIITSSILPSFTTALNFPPRPVPIPTTSKSGAELYSLPFVCISTKVILPSVIIGFNWASLPVLTVTDTDFSRLRISEPYPVPLSYSKISDMLPLRTGVAVITPTSVLANSYFKFNLMSGNLNTCKPVHWLENLI